MPELPEVETYVRELAPQLEGRSVTAATVTWPRIIAHPSAQEFELTVIGARFTNFVHAALTLDNRQEIHFQDTRKFGRMWLTDEPESIIGKLGPEPLGEEFSAQYLAERIALRRASIKALILNQSVIAGIGNIYADESLFHSRIHPARTGNSLSFQETARLHDAIVTLLTEAIDHQGSTLGTSHLQNYSRPGGQSGSFQENFKVFRRTGEPCPSCGHPIERIVVGQRSTHFCPACQPLITDK